MVTAPAGSLKIPYGLYELLVAHGNHGAMSGAHGLDANPSPVGIVVHDGVRQGGFFLYGHDGVAAGVEGLRSGIAGSQLHAHKAGHVIDDACLEHFPEGIIGCHHARAAAAGNEHCVRGTPKFVHKPVGKGPLAGNAVGVGATALEPVVALDHGVAHVAGFCHVPIDAHNTATIEQALEYLGLGDMLLHKDNRPEPRTGAIGRDAGCVVAGGSHADSVATCLHCLEHAQGSAPVLEGEGGTLFYLEVEFVYAKLRAYAI